MLYAIDQEGGIVARVGDPFAAPYDLRYLDASASRDAFAGRGAMLAALGVDINFGIIADVTPDPGIVHLRPNPRR